MRTIDVSSRLLAAALAAALAGGACSKDITGLETLPTLNPGSSDARAGEWRMILLSGPGQFPVAPPAEVGSDAYRAEIAAIKTAQAGITAAQREAIDYWSVGGVLRWNQILRELVARYNLPPAPRDDGTYPAPDANNPFADPAFPFANPPYSARAYSYVLDSKADGCWAKDERKIQGIDVEGCRGVGCTPEPFK